MIETGPSFWPPILVAGSVAIVVAALGGWATDVGPWYQKLKKPRWQPPNWVFAPVWTTIFALAATSAVLAWQAATSDGTRALIIALFAVNAVLNVIWSVLFFKWRRPDWALVEVIVFWLSIVALIVGLWPVSPLSSYLLAPYIAWVSVAAFLNLTIIRLNGSFRDAARRDTA